ncbi:MAG: hypothetical protein IKO61_06425 [Lachnospiraceae bacterium]|nr:hypothetical protein [Lachnospiraceae bacterium]
MSGFNIPKYQIYNSTHNYTGLFASLNKSSGANATLYSNLGDLSAIRNGSYRKLAAKHFANASSTETKTTKKSEETKSENQKKIDEILENAKKNDKVLRTYNAEGKSDSIKIEDRLGLDMDIKF